MRSRDGKYGIIKTPNKTFKVRFYDERGERRSVNVATVTERDYLLRTIRRCESLDQWFPPEPGTGSDQVKKFSELTERFLDHRQGVREVSASCLGNYRTQLGQHILPVLGRIAVEDLTLRDIERLALKLTKTRPKTRSYLAVRKELHEHDEFLSASYRREILTLACSIAKFGFERDYLQRHPFKAFELPDAGDKPYDYWRLDEEDKFLDWLQAGGKYVQPHTDRAGERYDRHWRVWNHDKVYEVVLLALRTGMRKGEITALTMDHVDCDENIITVQAAWSEKAKKYRNQTKNGGYRRIEMNPDVAEILWKYRDTPRTERLFDKIMQSHTIKHFSKLTRLANVREIHFHALRHTFLTNIANGIGMDAPVDIVKVMELAGHSDLKTTMIYVHSAGIKDTSSRLWSRAQRKELAQKVIPLKRKEAQA
jgi:integrase